MRKCLLGCVTLVLAVAVAGCGGVSDSQKSSVTGSSKPYAELRWGTEPFPGPINFWTTFWSQEEDVQSLAVQSLVEFEPNGKLRPGLASSVEQPSPTTYAYHIRTGVKFSDGHPLTVADVVRSLDQNFYKSSWSSAYWGDVSSVSVHGRSTVVVKLKHPEAAWPGIFAYSSVVIENAQDKALGTPGHLPIGTGPWQIDSFTPETSVQLSRNPYWTGPRQPAAKVSFTFFKSEATMSLALRSGAIDGAAYYGTLKSFLGIPGVHALRHEPRWDMSELVMNTSSAPFNNVHVRRAIAYATDAKGIIKALLPAGYGEEEATTVPRSLFVNFDPARVNEMLGALPKYEYNLTAARRELAKSGYPHGFSTEVQVQAAEASNVEVAQIVAADLAKIGIEAKVHAVQTNEWFALSTGGKGGKLLIGTWDPLYADPESNTCFYEEAEIKPAGSGCNAAHFRNAEVNHLLKEQSETLNQASRLRLIGKLLKITAEEEPYRPLYSIGLTGSLSNKYVYPHFSFFTFAMTPWAMEVKLAK